MSHLIDAIHAEARGDFRAAAEHYRHLTETGSPLDRAGIWQALARCHEKLGDLKWQGARQGLKKICHELGDENLLKRIPRWRSS